MPKNDEGEFELILGNRQLLSVFFIVVVLLGVFFTMGYIVGRNSSTGVSSDIARKNEPKTIIVEPAASPASTTPSPGASTPHSGTQSAASSPADQAEPAPSQRAEPKPPKESRPEPASPTPGVPAAGATYLQLAAIAKPEAELFVDVLAKKGFHALYVPVPEKSTFRVLVGPFPNAAAVSQARGDLTKAGFKGYEAIIRQY